MVPHLHYDARFVSDYFPGPDRWPRAARHVESPGALTSGISNPPILPIAVRLIGERQPDSARRDAFWRRCLPRLVRWQRWFLDARRPAGAQLPVVVHPWEAGWDNSPRWDHLRAAGLRPARRYERLDTRHVAAGERPSGTDYDSYLALAELLDAADYDVGAYLERSPFAVHDVVVDALWYAGARDLNAIAGTLGEPPAFGEAELADYAACFERVHWEPEARTYVDWDVVGRRPITVQSAAGPAALAGGLVRSDRADLVWRRYRELSGPALLVCTVPPTAPQFEPARYWRGPVWLNVNWLVARGLDLAGLRMESEQVRSESIALVSDGGFHEYFDAISGEGRGIDGFTWSAALTLDWLQ